MTRRSTARLEELWAWAHREGEISRDDPGEIVRMHPAVPSEHVTHGTPGSTFPKSFHRVKSNYAPEDSGYTSHFERYLDRAIGRPPPTAIYLALRKTKTTLQRPERDGEGHVLLDDPEVEAHIGWSICWAIVDGGYASPATLARTMRMDERELRPTAYRALANLREVWEALRTTEAPSAKDGSAAPAREPERDRRALPGAN